MVIVCQFRHSAAQGSEAPDLEADRLPAGSVPKERDHGRTGIDLEALAR